MVSHQERVREKKKKQERIKKSKEIDWKTAVREQTN